MTTDEHVPTAGEPIDLDELLEDLDAILDAWFMGLVTPALDDARFARLAGSAGADLAA